MMMMCCDIAALHAPSSVRVEHTGAPAPVPDQSSVMTTVTSSRVIEEQISSSQQLHQQHAAPPHTQGTTS